MKRVDAIAMGKAQKTTESIERKSKRIMRGVEQAIDYARDKIEVLEDRLDSFVNSLGDVASAEDTTGLQNKINNYAVVLHELEEWEAQLNRLIQLRETLLVEVDVKEEK